jgi:hypothetical protein
MAGDGERVETVRVLFLHSCSQKRAVSMGLLQLALEGKKRNPPTARRFDRSSTWTTISPTWRYMVIWLSYTISVFLSPFWQLNYRTFVPVARVQEAAPLWSGAQYNFICMAFDHAEGATRKRLSQNTKARRSVCVTSADVGPLPTPTPSSDHSILNFQRSNQ